MLPLLHYYKRNRKTVYRRNEGDWSEGKIGGPEAKGIGPETKEIRLTGLVQNAILQGL